MCKMTKSGDMRAIVDIIELLDFVKAGQTVTCIGLKIRNKDHKAMSELIEVSEDSYIDIEWKERFCD